MCVTENLRVSASSTGWAALGRLFVISELVSNGLFLFLYFHIWKTELVILPPSHSCGED